MTFINKDNELDKNLLDPTTNNEETVNKNSCDEHIETTEAEPKQSTLEEQLYETLHSDEQDEALKTESIKATHEEESYEENTQTTNLGTKISNTLQHIMKLCASYINNLLTQLRHDNRSLITGLLVVSAISCFLTVSFIQFTQNKSNDLYEHYPSSAKHYYNQYPYSSYEYPIESYKDYSYSFDFEFNRYPDTIDEIHNFLNELFGEYSHHFSQPSNESIFPDSELQEF